jgi:hypothetical protein
MMPAQPPTLPYIPLVYRLLLFYIEPFFALNGAYLLMYKPKVYLNTFSPNLAYAPSNQIIFDQLAAVYVLFAFNQGVVLRIAKDIRVWKAILLGILVCDSFHAWTGFKVMAADNNMNPAGWRPEDWTAILALFVPGAMRIAFLCDVGIGNEKGRLSKQRKA